MTTPTAAPCRRCLTTGGYIQSDAQTPERPRGLCKKCYDAEWYRNNLGHWPVTYRYDAHPTLPTGIVTAAMLGIKPGQPPTDPALTPAKVRAIGNTNARRAQMWLAEHTNVESKHDLDRAVWQPATLDAGRAAA